MSWDWRLGLAGVDGTRFANRDVEQIRLGTVGRSTPIGPAGKIGTRPVTFFRWIRVRNNDRASLRSEAVGPSLVDVGSAQQKLAGQAVKDVVETIANRLDQQLARLTFEYRVQQDRSLIGVPVMGVMRRVLEMPFQPSRVGVEGEHAAGV